MADLVERQEKIADEVRSLYPWPESGTIDESDESEKLIKAEVHLPKKSKIFGKLGLIKFLFWVLIRGGTTLI